jgi:predicted small lipoprotein YifL
MAMLLAACGQKGDLFLPTDPAAANRATLPQILTPGIHRGPATTDPSPPAQTPDSAGGRGTGTAAPIRQP